MKLPLLLSALLLATLTAAPLDLKDVKGREISVTVTDYNKDTVTFTKGEKTYTVPWTTFDKTSIELIKKTPPPGAANKRQKREEKIPLDDGTTKKITVPAGLYFSKEGVLDLYPGDTIHLEFSLIGGVLTKPIVVTSITNPEQTITFEFTQDKNVSTLKRTSKINKTIDLDCYEMNLQTNKFEHSANVYPNEKDKLHEFSSWPNNVWRLQIKNIVVSDKTAD